MADFNQKIFSDMKIKELLVIVDLRATRSFTQTADNLGMSKSQISKIIVKIERIVEGQLVVRTTRSVELTPLAFDFASRVELAHAILCRGNAVGVGDPAMFFGIQKELTQVISKMDWVMRSIKELHKRVPEEE